MHHHLTFFSKLMMRDVRMQVKWCIDVVLRWLLRCGIWQPSNKKEYRAVWTNADEVNAFIEDHKGGKWAVGDRCVLPDIEQAYEVIAVRPFKHRGKFRLFVDLEAACAVDDCGSYFIVTKEVHQWMASPHLTRCCPEHRFGFGTPMPNAWKTQEQIAQIPVKVKKVKQPRVGANERALLDAIEDLSLVYDSVPSSVLVVHAVEKLPRGASGKRDTRGQSVVRALKGLVDRGRVQLDRGAVLL